MSTRPDELWNAIRRARLVRVLLVYIGASFFVLEAIDILTGQLGLPDWVFRFAIVLLLIGLPIIVATALVQGALTRAPAGPALDLGEPLPEFAEARSAAEVAAVAKGWLTWKTAILGGVLAFALMTAVVAGYMTMRTLGIGPVGSLVAKGVIDADERIVLADFENLTNDSLLADVVTEAFRIDISQSPLITVAEPAYVARVLGRMQRDPEAGLDVELAGEVAVREGLKAVIAGEVGAVGDSYVLSIRLMSTESGEELASFRETASDSDELLRAIDKLSKRLRERIGESLRTIRANEPLEAVTTSSLEALLKYSQGIRASQAGDHVRGLELLEEAVAIDTLFAMAYRKLGAWALTQTRRTEALTRAYELRDRLTERERYLTRGTYYFLIEGDRTRSMNAYLTLLESYDDPVGANNLASIYLYLRDHATAEELFDRAFEFDPSDPGYLLTRMDMEWAQGKFEEAESTLALYAREDPGHPSIRVNASLMASSRGDYETAERELLQLREEQRANPLWQLSTAGSLGALALARGHLGEGEDHLRLGIAAGHQLGQAQIAFGFASAAAWVDLLIRGDAEAGLAKLEDVRARYPLESIGLLDRPYLDLASFYAYAGRTERAKEMVAQYQRMIPPELRRQPGQETSYHHALGDIAMAEERFSDAVAEFRVADESAECPICELPLLGGAYDDGGEADYAIAIYERYLATPWLDREFSDAINLPWLYERLAALYEGQRETEKALYHYGRLVDLWETADPELQPRVEAARRAIAALSSDR